MAKDRPIPVPGAVLAAAEAYAPPGWSSLLEALPFGLLLVDRLGGMVAANPAASRILGTPAATLLTTNLQEQGPSLSAPDGARLAAAACPWTVAARTGAPVPGQTLGWVREDGSSLWLEIAAQPADEGLILVSFRDNTAAVDQANQFRHMNQLYAALSQVNQAIVRSRTPQALLDRMCRVMVDFGKFPMAWIGLEDPATHEVGVVSRYGDSNGYLDELQVRSDDTPLGRGATGIAIREGRPCVLNDFQGTKEASPWHDRALRSGFAASAALPIREGGKVTGALMVYAAEPGFFGSHELALLEEAAGDVSFALDHLAMDERRQRAEQTLKESEERYRTQFDLASEGIITHTLDGALLEVNEAFARMHGYTREEMVQMRLKDLNLPGFFKMPPERLARILAGEAQTFEVRHIHKDGQVFPLEVSAGMVTTQGRSLITAFHRDITGRKRAEADRADLQAKLMQAQKMESLGTLAGGVAHDMNNVLGAILATASFNQPNHLESSRAFRAFDTICRAAERGGKLVQSLLHFARKSPAEERELDLNVLVQETIELLAHTTLAKVELAVALDPALRPILGDGNALAHSFMNLCVNAVDAMPERGTLTLRTRNLDNGWMEVEVEDTGTGMPREVLDKVLEPFFTTKEDGKGTGLGLSTVYSTVKAHQGDMKIQSEPGRGTCVTMSFPAVP